MTTNRFVGGSAVLPINKFRDDEFLNEDNKYNKIVFENARKYILSQMNEDTMKPLNQITDQQKYVLTMLIQRFLNELDSSVKKYYDNTDTDNAEKLIFKWNELVNYYNTNVDKAFKPNLDSRLAGDGDVLEKLQILMDVAIEANYNDKVEIIKLRNYVMTTNYKTIQNIIFRKGEEQELPETRMEQVKSGDFNVRRMRFPKVGRPTKGVRVIKKKEAEAEEEEEEEEETEETEEEAPPPPRSKIIVLKKPEASLPKPQSFLEELKATRGRPKGAKNKPKDIDPSKIPESPAKKKMTETQKATDKLRQQGVNLMAELSTKLKSRQKEGDGRPNKKRKNKKK
jgi:hypothetical protein